MNTTLIDSIAADAHPSHAHPSHAHPCHARRISGAVTAARIVLVVHGLVLAGLGVALLGSTAVPQALALATVVEGALRIVLAALLRQGARRARQATIVLCALGAVAAAMNLPFGIIGIAVNVAVARCLNTESSKAHLGA